VLKLDHALNKFFKNVLEYTTIFNSRYIVYVFFLKGEIIILFNIIGNLA